jgi:hypothetical protein
MSSLRCKLICTSLLWAYVEPEYPREQYVRHRHIHNAHVSAGESFVLFRVPSLYMYKTLSSCELIVLTASQLAQLATMHAGAHRHVAPYLVPPRGLRLLAISCCHRDGGAGFNSDADGSRDLKWFMQVHDEGCPGADESELAARRLRLCAAHPEPHVDVKQQRRVSARCWKVCFRMRS